MPFQSIRAVTWTVPNVAVSAAAFTGSLGYRRVKEGAIEAPSARLWRSPGVAGNPYVILAPESGEPVFLRLIQSARHPATAPGIPPLMTYGWNAAELHVRDVYSLAEQLADSPFQIIGPPRDLLDNGAVVAMQVLGPGQELLYLTQISHPGMQRQYGSARCAVDRVFIAVLGVEDQARTMRFYQPWALRCTERRAFRITVLAKAHGLDPDHARFNIASLVMAQPFRIETDDYPPSARPRPVIDGQLPEGLSMVSIVVDAAEMPDDMDWQNLADDVFKTSRAALLRGPDGELIELLAH